MVLDLGPKRAQGPLCAQRVPGAQRAQGPKGALGPKRVQNIKVPSRKTMQNAPANIRNGAICCSRVPAKAEANVPADKTSVVSADKTAVVSLCHQTSPKASAPTFPPQGRPRSGRPCVENAWGMSWEMSADTMTQQMSCLLTQQMSCLQTQQMSCLQTHFLRILPHPARNDFRSELATYGFVCNTDHWILRGLSVRNFGMFNPRDYFWITGSGFGFQLGCLFLA